MEQMMKDPKFASMFGAGGPFAQGGAAPDGNGATATDSGKSDTVDAEVVD